MKILFLLFISIGVVAASYTRTFSQEQEIQQLLLNVEKLIQLKEILADMKQGYELLSEGYHTVQALTQGDFTLHDVFLKKLLDVNPAVRNYYKIGRIVMMQKEVLQHFRSGYAAFESSGQFSPDEIRHFRGTGEHLVRKSTEHIAALTSILTAETFRMSDAERLNAIDHLYDELSAALQFIRGYNNSSALLALQRFKEGKDIERLKSIHGID